MRQPRKWPLSALNFIEAEIEDEGVLSFPAPLLFAAICMPHEAIIESYLVR